MLIRACEQSTVVQKAAVVLKNSSFELRLVSAYGNSTLDTVRFSEFNNFIHIRDVNPKLDKKYSLDVGVSIEFIPASMILYDQSINLDYYIDKINTDRIFIRFIYVKAFDIAPKLFDFGLEKYSFGFRFLEYHMSSLILHKHGQPLTDKQCTIDNFRHLSMGKFTILAFHYGIKYSMQTCAYIFRNSRINEVQFVGIADTFIKRNTIGFIHPSSESSFLNSTLRRLRLDLYEAKIESSFLNEHLFSRLIILEIDGSLGEIASDVFRPFKTINFIQLEVENVPRLFGRGLEWLHSINFDLNFNLTLTEQLHKSVNESLTNKRFTIIKTYSDEKTNGKISKDSILHPVNEPYLFPDEDFCTFVNFPFHKLVFLNPHTDCYTKKCSCTQYWLRKYAFLLNNSFIIEKMSFYFWQHIKFYLISYEKQLNECNVTRMLQMCNKSKFMEK